MRLRSRPVSGRGATPAWDGYVEEFHAEHPGITESVLAGATHGGTTPYEWCADGLVGRTASTTTLDLACGSGPMAGRVDGWVGSDTSAAELDRAVDAGRTRVVRASATELPVAGRTLGAVTCAMAFQVIRPLDAAIAELARVLAPGGRASLLLPSTGPLPPRDIFTYARLQLALRQVVRYPNDAELAPDRLAATLARHGLQLMSDERRPFRIALVSKAEADALVDSLYLPGVTPAGRARGRTAMSHRVGRGVTVPLRRIIVRRP